MRPRTLFGFTIFRISVVRSNFRSEPSRGSNRRPAAKAFSKQACSRVVCSITGRCT
jgi:hypothetical protein